MRKYAPKMKGKAFLSILNKKFPGGACPRTPLAAWALRAQVTRPKGVYIRVTPVTTKATAVQNSTENPGMSQLNDVYFCFSLLDWSDCINGSAWLFCAL